MAGDDPIDPNAPLPLWEPADPQQPGRPEFQYPQPPALGNVPPPPQGVPQPPVVSPSPPPSNSWQPPPLGAVPPPPPPQAPWVPPDAPTEGWSPGGPEPKAPFVLLGLGAVALIALVAIALIIARTPTKPAASTRPTFAPISNGIFSVAPPTDIGLNTPQPHAANVVAGFYDSHPTNPGVSPQADGTITISSGGISQSGGSGFSCTSAFISCTASAHYVLNRDLNAVSVRVESGVVLYTNSYVINASSTVTVDQGAIVADNGITAQGWNESTQGTDQGGTGLVKHTLGGSGSGGHGGGADTTGSGTPCDDTGASGLQCPQNGNPAPGVGSSAGGSGGKGGDGNGVTGGAGGSAAGNPPSGASSLGSLGNYSGGLGGGGGGTGTASSAGGGGGSGGGILEIRAANIVNNGTIEAVGGDGGGGYDGNDDGGGGGGGGGVIYLVYSSALSGSGGTLVDGGNGGQANGTAGDNGKQGTVVKVKD